MIVVRFDARQWKHWVGGALVASAALGAMYALAASGASAMGASFHSEATDRHAASVLFDAGLRGIDADAGPWAPRRGATATSVRAGSPAR
jgi:hypothetical protein